MPHQRTITKVIFGGTPSHGFAHPSINVVPATLPFSNLSKKVLLEENFRMSAFDPQRTVSF